jgi:hypothetical protein
MERVRQRDYFVVNLGPSDDRQRFLVREVLPEGLAGLWFQGNTSESEPRTISNAELAGYEILITHYFGEMEIRYSSSIEFLLKHSVRYEYLPYWRERLGQYLFNKRKLDEKRRIQVLRLLVQSHLDDDPISSAMDVMSELYGPRWRHHPQQLQLYRYYDLMLSSFVDGGELVQEEQYVRRIAPQALNTIDAYNENQLKHEGTMSVQRWMLIVTFLVGCATAVQAYMAMFPAKPLETATSKPLAPPPPSPTP